MVIIKKELENGDMLKNDYVMRMIENIGRFLAKLLLGREEVKYELPEAAEYTGTDGLFLEIQDLLREGNICKAEDMLLEELDKDNKRTLELALDFYGRLNNMSDDYLEEHDFSRDEVQQGLEQVAKVFGVPL